MMICPVCAAEMYGTAKHARWHQEQEAQFSRLISRCEAMAERLLELEAEHSELQPSW